MSELVQEATGLDIMAYEQQGEGREKDREHLHPFLKSKERSFIIHSQRIHASVFCFVFAEGGLAAAKEAASAMLSEKVGQ